MSGVRDLTLLHTRFTVLETARVPMAVIGSMVFPTLALLFFVVPMREVAGNHLYATQAVVGMSFFAVMTNCLFSFGVGVAEDREKPWDPYLRTLPVGPGPRIAARLLNGLIWSLLSLVPLLVVGWLLTEAGTSVGRFLLCAPLLAAGAMPFLFGGLAMGYCMSAKAALAVAQVLMFGMAFGGGLFLPPSMFPGWLDLLSRFLPSRIGRDLLEWGALGGSLPLVEVAGLVAWAALTLLLAVWAYRRDEGRRFR
ncbi:MAG TPA: ABC transporter permease [Segeticoccus sp.]|jgi:ABC-2 type transport system permease protein|nr:ABC transporter permease [Segeticoccus sp.]